MPVLALEGQWTLRRSSPSLYSRSEASSGEGLRAPSTTLSEWPIRAPAVALRSMVAGHTGISSAGPTEVSAQKIPRGSDE